MGQNESLHSVFQTKSCRRFSSHFVPKHQLYDRPTQMSDNSMLTFQNSKVNTPQTLQLLQGLAETVQSSITEEDAALCLDGKSNKPF